MKKLFTLLILCIPFLGFAQNEWVGEWKISALKILRLSDDNTFHLTKGGYHHYGEYEVLPSERNTILRLKFENTVIDYEILFVDSKFLELKDIQNDQFFKARKINQKQEVAHTTTESSIENKSPKTIDNPLYKDHYRNKYPNNQYYFSLGGGGGISFASGSTTSSQTIEEGNVVEQFSTTHIYSYSGGFKIGYQIIDDLFLGLGGTYVYSGFEANRQASASDPEYQFDAESTQKAQYTYSSIEVPIWFNYMTSDRWSIEAGGIVSIPIRSTSKAVFNGSNTVMVNGEIDPRTSYESNEYVQEYANLPESYAIGGYAEIQRRLAKHLLFSVSYKHISDYMKFDNELISNNIIQANLTLQLF